MILSETQKDQIKKAIQRAESSTSGEIVPMIVSRSDHYIGTQWRFAFVFSLLSAFLYHELDPHASPLNFLWIQFPALALGHFLGSIAQIKRIFLTLTQMNLCVHRRALEAFHTNKLSSTRDRTGILIMVSTLERRVEIIADSGINSKLTPEVWGHIVNKLIVHIKQKELIDGLTEAIDECGQLLATHFPRAKDDVNELTDALILED